MAKRDFTSQVAESIPFDTTNNNFPPDKDNVQLAIEHAKQNAEGFPRAGLRSFYNGTMGDNDWLGPSELLSNTPLAVFPVDVRINEITWGNSRSDVSFDIEFRRGSKTGPIVYTLSVTPSNPGYGYVTGVNVDFTPGESLWAQYKDTGLNAADMDLVLWISRIVV